jgi:hypothetical protein
MKVPFINLRIQHQDEMERIQQAVGQIFEETSFILGPHVEQFERACEKYLGVPFAIGVNSGTDALLMSLKALGVGPAMKSSYRPSPLSRWRTSWCASAPVRCSWMWTPSRITWPLTV